MTDCEKRAHELAMLVVSEILSRDFKTMINADSDKDERRELLADSTLEEYEFYFQRFKKSMK